MAISGASQTSARAAAGRRWSMMARMTRVLSMTTVVAWLVLVLAPHAGAGQSGQRPAAQAPPPPLVKVGDPMPDFSLPYLEPSPDGGRPQTKTARLSDYAGKQVVVLAFFPAAFSPG